MKRVMKIKSKSDKEEIEITIKIKGKYSDSWSPRDKAGKRINELTTKIVSEILFPEKINFKDIKIKR